MMYQCADLKKGLFFKTTKSSLLANISENKNISPEISTILPVLNLIKMIKEYLDQKSHD